MHQRIGRRGVTLGAAAAAIAGSARAAEPVTITMSSTSFANAALFLSDKLGLFEKHGAPVRLVVVDSGSIAVTTLLSGSAQFTASGVSDVLVASARGQKFKLVADLYRGLSGSLVIAKSVAEKAGVTAESPLEARRRAVVGLQVAIPSATSSYVPPVNGAAALAGGKPTLVYMAQPAMVASLRAGAVQAIMCGSPFWEPAVTSGGGFILLEGPAGDFPADASPVATTALMTTGDYAAANPQTVKAMKAALDELAALIKSDPEAVKAALAKAYPRLDADTVPLSFGKNSRAWTGPTLTVDDVRHEMAILARSRPVAGLDTLDPASLLVAG